MKILNLLLGAGFSVKAGLPLVGLLSERLSTPDYRWKILRQSSGEWSWAEGRHQNEVRAGMHNADHLAYACVMNEVVKDYLTINGRLDNYEIFYDFLKSRNAHWLESIQEKSKAAYQGDLSSSALQRVGTIGKGEIIGLLNYLISDLLILRQDAAKLCEEYCHFIEYISRFDEVNVHTLNHDLLAETLLNHHVIPYSDGFSTEGTVLKDRDGDRIPIFNDVFDKPISIIKLHGSIDTYAYDVGSEHGSTLNLTGEKLYFKPKDYFAKHNTLRFDPINGKVIQSFPTHDIIPKFLTGLNKPNIIIEDIMYKDLYLRFERNIKGASGELAIIGYSYSDPHVNQILQQANTNLIIRNINPGVAFPYKRFEQRIEFNYIDEKDAFK